MSHQPDNPIENGAAEHGGQHGYDNLLFDLIARSNCLSDEMSSDTALKLMRNLISQFRLHFAFEEQVLYQSKYKRTSDHVVQHWKFIQRLSAMANTYERGARDVILEFHEYIPEWLSDHISVDDLEFCEFLRENIQTVSATTRHRQPRLHILSNLTNPGTHNFVANVQKFTGKIFGKAALAGKTWRQGASVNRNR